MFLLRHDQLSARVKTVLGRMPRIMRATYRGETERALCGLFPRCQYIPRKRKLGIKFHGEIFCNLPFRYRKYNGMLLK